MKIQSIRKLFPIMNPSICLGAIVWVLAAATTRAALITGSMTFSGAVTLNTSSTATASAVTGWFSPVVTSRSGIFTNAPYAIANGAAVTFKNSVWSFNDTAPIPLFWSVGGYNFELQSSSVFSRQTGTFTLVAVNGRGVVSGNGYEPTSFNWSFTSSDPGSSGRFTFSASVTSLGSNGAPVLMTRKIPGALVFNWTDTSFALQVATNANGPYSNVAGATSPYTNQPTSTRQFFRLRQ